LADRVGIFVEHSSDVPLHTF